MKAFISLEKRAKEPAKVSCRAFTLVEMLVAACIFFILVAMAFLVLNSGVSSWLAGDVEVDLRRELVKAIVSMEKELKLTRASQTNLASGAVSNSLTFAIPQDINGDGTILDATGQVEWSPNRVTYSLNANGEIIRTTTARASVLARNITRLTFTRPVSPVNILQVDISAQRQNIKGRIFTDTGQLIIKMRN